jgi:hypothetical protein
LAAVVVASLGVGTARGEAQTSGGAELGSDYVRATAADLGSGTFPAGGLPARAPSIESLFTWERQRSTLVCVILAGPPPAWLVDHIRPIPGPTVITDQVIGPGDPIDVPPGAVSIDDRSLIPADATIVGDLVYDVGQQPTMLLVVPRCIGPGTPLLGDPPSPAEIWEQTLLPRTAIHASPPGTAVWPGITRLTTYFWGRALPDAVASVSLRGFDVRVVAHPIAYAWSFGEGTTIVAPDPASAGAPVRVTFVRRGDYRVTLFVVWEGRAHISFAGLDLADQDLGTVTLPQRTRYHVAEIRALLRTTPGRG